MLTTKKTFQTKFLSTLLILALVSTMILAPTALAAGFGGSSITTAVADSGARNFTPTEAANDTEIQAMTDNSSVLNESDIIYMILTDRFYDADPTNNGTLNQEYRPGQLKYTQGGDWKGITQKLDYIKNLGVTAIWISPPSQNELLSRDGEESGYRFHRLPVRQYLHFLNSRQLVGNYFCRLFRQFSSVCQPCGGWPPASFCTPAPVRRAGCSHAGCCCPP